MRAAERIAVASRAGWNRLVDRWWTGRLREVVWLEPPRWRAPFTCDLRWDAAGERWTVGIVPGWCESPTGDASPEMATVARLARETARRLEVVDEEEPVLARLDEGPRMPVPTGMWRAVGTDAVEMEGMGQGALPPEIAARGVMGPARLARTEGGVVERVGGLAEDRASAPLARAVEVFLEHGREVVSLGAIGGAGAEVELEVAFLPPRPAGPRIGLRGDWPEPGTEAGSWLPSGLAVAADEGIDRRRIATLWLTSPPGEPRGSSPDGRWRPYVEQRLARNVAYETTGPALRAVEPLRLTIAGREFAGGAAAGMIDSLAGDLRSRAAELDARLAGTGTSGEFVPF